MDVQQDNPNLFFNAIAFGQGHYAENMAKKIPFDICYAIEPNEWNGKVTLQLNIKDMAF
jgi:single-stranded-DNA-specific exonuclease